MEERYSPEKEIPELNRMEHAILIVLYENHPIPMSQEQIMNIIAERNLLDMSESDFMKYKRDIIKSKKN
jgi:hypothetical protein